jgi:hypothetical protein
MSDAGPWEMRAYAIRTLGVSPDQYWTLTPSELGEMFAGYSWRRDRQWDIAGWMTAHMINMAGKKTRKKVTVDKLLGRKKQVMRNLTHDDKVLGFQEIIRRQRILDGLEEE